MAINPDIRDQAYQFFIEEAPDLLHLIETGLLNLHQDRSTAKIHSLMRSAHSLKGGAAGVGLDAIATLAHRLENIFKALYNETLAADPALESWLLQAYDCLRLPLTQQITTGWFDPTQTLATAEPVFSQIEAYCGDALTQADSYIPSSAEMGVDMVLSIFEVDVAQGLEQITAVLPQSPEEIMSELQIQAEVFAGFAEVFNLPNFGAVAQTVQQALTLHPEYALTIAQLALTEFAGSRRSVLAGLGGLPPSEVLLRFTAAEVDPDWVATCLSSKNLEREHQSDEQIKIQVTEDITEPIFEHDFEHDAKYFSEHDNTSTHLTPEESLRYPLESTLELADSFDRTQDESLPSESFSSVESLAEEVIELEKASEYELVGSNLVENDITDLIGIDIEAASEFSEANQEVTIQESYQESCQNNDRNDNQNTSQNSHQPFADLLASPEPILRSRISPTFAPPQPAASTSSASLTVRVDSERLERMNNLVGELAINRSSLLLQNDQLQRVIRALRHRFIRFQSNVTQLQSTSDPVLERAELPGKWQEKQDRGIIASRSLLGTKNSALPSEAAQAYLPAVEFDALEMDRYGTAHAELQAILEDLVQLEEAVDDIALFARQSNQTLEQQQYKLTQLRDELVWARMLPLSEVLNRFPRILRDLSVTYQKSVQLKLTGAEVLIDRAILEKLYDPLLHLLRNAFDHGIEPIHVRQQFGKPEQGQIEICAFHQGSQTVIEVRDDGQGINVERIQNRIQELGWLSAEQVATVSTSQLIELIFEPGFSTAAQVSELSGRGFGLDVVRSQLQALRGTVSVTSSPQQGTTFTLTLPLTLTITQLIVCLVGSLPIALPTDTIEDIFVPQAHSVQPSNTHRSLVWRELIWREQSIPVYSLADLLQYTCPIPEAVTSQLLAAFPMPKDWSSPVVVVRREQQVFGLAVERIITEQELVIKPFSTALPPPPYLYGCTILGDGSAVPVVDAIALLSWASELSFNSATGSKDAVPLQAMQAPPDRPPIPKPAQSSTILVVDDAITLRRTLALFLEREGFRVLQAQDGQEAIEQLQHSSVQLVVCDIEMPNLNGFEFLNFCRQDPQLANIPVIILTSRSSEKHRWLALQLGATNYLTKPYLEQEFLSALKAALPEPR